MDLNTPLDHLKRLTDRPTRQTGRWSWPLALLYWLAGARTATLEQLPESERERVAILGSSVLIPTLLAFFGMYLYASSRFASPRPLLALFLALVWAFVIMNVDHILLATYRPFQPWRHKMVQVCFRIGLAGVISVAIAFPFCLEQYQGAISERLQGEYRARLNELQTAERTERLALETRDGARIGELRAQLARERAVGPTDPKLFAEELAKQAVRQQEDSARGRRQALDQETAAALTEWKGLSARIRQVEQDLKDEARGRLAGERGGTGKPGQGAKYNELARDLELLSKAEQAARQRYEQLLARAAAIDPADSPHQALAQLDADRQAALLGEARERKERIDKLTQAITRAEQEHDEQLASHKLRFDPVLKSYHAKAEGRFDPMEETIGLFKVIFVPETGNDAHPLVQRYKWMAALFQFTIVFGTLFLLDLIAILAKVMSRPGPYDVLVEFPELVASHNLDALGKEYPSQAEAWAGTAVGRANATPTDNGIDLRNPEEVARLLLRAHLSAAEHPRTDRPAR